MNDLDYMSYAKCIVLENSRLNTDTGSICWACEDGSFISESGYHYNINCFFIINFFNYKRNETAKRQSLVLSSKINFK